MDVALPDLYVITKYIAMYISEPHPYLNRNLMTQYFDAIKIHDQLLKPCVLDLIPSNRQPCHSYMYNESNEVSTDVMEKKDNPLPYVVAKCCVQNREFFTSREVLLIVTKTKQET